MEWYLKVVRDNYANFEGRARRKEYWMFYLFHMIFLVGLLMIAIMISAATDFFWSMALPILYFLATLIPYLAVCVRRLHDTNKSGWYYLVSFIPYIGGIWFFVLSVIDGDRGPNQYGPDPKVSFNEIEEIGKPVE